MDVHVPRAVTIALRLRSIDVTELGRVLVSQDADLLRQGTHRQRAHENFSGIIYAHQRTVIGQLVNDLELLAKATSLDEWRARIEYLPIR